MITELGSEASVNILEGNSTTKKRKPRIKKSKVSSQNTNVTTDIEIEDDEA